MYQSPAKRLVVLLLAVAAYLLAFIWLYPSAGPGIEALSFLPVTAAAWLFGFRGGLSVALLAVPANGVLLHGLGHMTWTTAATDASGPGVVGLILAAAGVGWLRTRSLLLNAHVREQERDRHAALAALRSSEARFRAVTERGSDLVSIVDATGVILYASPSYGHILNYPPDTLKGTHFLTAVHPEDRSRVEDSLAAAQHAGDIVLAEFRMRHHDGTWRDMEAAFVNQLLDPAVGGIIVTMHNISARKQAESERARLAAIVESSDDAIIGTSLDGLIESWNAGAAHLFGYSRDDVLGRPLTLLHPGSQPDEKASMHGDVQDETRVQQRETTRRCKDGRIVHVALTVSPIKEDSGRIVGTSIIARDTTVQQQARDEAERARAAAYALAEVRSDFVAAVSHELRTPLTSIIGYGELLQVHWQRLTESERLSRIDRMLIAANRQKRLVEDLLLLTQIEEDPAPLDRTVLSVATLVEQAVDEVLGTYADQQILLSGPSQLCVLADPDRALQVIVNLLDNAVKYSPEGSAVSVSWDEEAGMAVLRVRDCGSGIAAEGHQLLFTRFGRVPGSRIRSGRVGTGLGLYLGRQLAEAMGGDLDLADTGPQGSTFRLRLPLPPAEETHTNHS